VLEAVWKAAPEDERELWRGLAQIAVGVTHLRRGNPRGAQALLDRAADRLAEFRTSHPYGLDLPTLIRDVRSLADTANDVQPLADAARNVQPLGDTAEGSRARGYPTLRLIREP
jgi:hypothetical protein